MDNYKSLRLTIFSLINNYKKTKDTNILNQLNKLIYKINNTQNFSVLFNINDKIYIIEDNPPFENDDIRIVFIDHFD